MFRRMIGMSPSDWRREQLMDGADEEQPFDVLKADCDGGKPSCSG
jgi:hypothetical protein